MESSLVSNCLYPTETLTLTLLPPPSITGLWLKSSSEMASEETLEARYDGVKERKGPPNSEAVGGVSMASGQVSV